MRAWTRAAVVAGLMLTGLVVLPATNSGAAAKPAVVQPPAPTGVAATTAPTTAPLVSAYPSGVSHAVFLKALESAIASGRMQRQATKRVNGAMVPANSAASGFALPAGPAPAACINVSGGGWPNLSNSGAPCYLATYNGRYVLAHGPQDIFPGHSAVLGAQGSPTSSIPGQVVPAAWQLSWNNLFDFEPLMRSSTGQTGNDITGLDTEFMIPPGLDNTSCYSATTGPYGGGFNAGRFQNQCTLPESSGPYYGTPAGQPVPWTMMSGAIDNGSGSGIPAVFNCGGTCDPEWVGVQIETPVMLEPSPYAGFSDSIGTDNQTVTFTDRTLSDLQITSWNWNFGDGATSTVQNPVHKYAKGGQYTVTLTVTANGQTSTGSTTVTPPGKLTVSATMSPSTIEVGTDTGVMDVTVTNPNKDPVSDLVVSTGADPADGSLTFDPDATCVTNCADPLAAGASSEYELGVSGEGENDPTPADVVNINADATIDDVDVTGTTKSPVVTVNDELTVTDVDPTGGQIFGGDPVTVTGTGFQSLMGTDTVTSVDFESDGGDKLAASNIDVVSPTELTVDAPDASSLVDPTATGDFDVVVSTSYAESPITDDDSYTYGCQTETSTPIGGWQFSGCFNSPKADEYTSTTKASLDGLDVNPAGGSSTVDFDTDAGTLNVPAGGNVAVTVGGTASPVCNGPLNWDLTAASVSCPAPNGHLLGLATTGPVTLTPQAGGTASGSVPVRLPGILGATAGTLKFAVSGAGGLTSATITAPTAGSIAQLVSGKVTSMTLNVGTGVWTATGTATTSFGGTSTLSATVSYDSAGNLAGGSLKLGRVDLAGAVTWTSLSLGYSTSTKLWTGTPAIVGAAAAGTVSLAVTDTTGALTAGTITTAAINLLSAMPLGSLTLTYGSSAWDLASTPDESGDGTVSASFPVTAGQIEGATITQDSDPINVYSQLPSHAAELTYSVAASLPVYTGTLTVDLPGATDDGTPATLTSTNDVAAKIKIALTTKTALFGGVTLTSLAAPVTAPAGSAGTTVCGSAGMNLGPQVGTSPDQIATLKGAMSFAYPTSGGVLYQMIGKLAVPTWKVAGGSLGIASLGLLQDQATASAKLALGTGTATGTCPLAKLPTPSTLTLKPGVTVSGTLTGTEDDSDFFLQGPATIAYPPVTLLPASASGTVVVNEIGLTACANVSGHAGKYGFSMTWAGVFSSYATGNCVLPTTSSGFGCLTQTATPAGLWQFSGCFSTPASGQFASTLPVTLDGLGLNPAAGTSTVIDTGAKTASLPSGGTLSIPRGTTSATLCTGPLSWNLAAATVTCTPPAGTRLFGLPVTGAVTLTPQAGGIVHGSAPVRLPGILGAPGGTLTFVLSGTGVLTSASVAPSGSTSIAGLVTGTVTTMTLNVTTGLWTTAGSVTSSTGATTTLNTTINYDATGNLSVGTLKLGRVDLGGAVTWNALSLTYDTTTKVWTGSPVIVGAAAAGSMSLNIVDATGVVTAGSLTTGAVSLFGALPLGSLTLTNAGTAWSLTSTPAAAGAGTVSATFPVTAGQLVGATITQEGNPIKLYGQLPSSSGVFTYSVVAALPVYNGTLTVALPGASAPAAAATLKSTNDGAAAIRVATTTPTALFAGVDLTSISAPVKAKTATVGTTVCGPTSTTVGPVVSGSTQLATLKGGALNLVYPTSGAVPYQLSGKLAIPAWKTGAGSLGIASIALVQGQSTGAVTLALGTGTASPACPLPALPAPSALTLKKGVTVTGKLTGTEGSAAFFLSGSGTFAYPASTVLPASATGTITANTSGITACAAVSGHSGKYGFSMTWAGVFTTFDTGNCVLPTS